MTEALVVDACRTPEGGKQANTATLCLWCECELKKLVSEKKLKNGATGDNVKKLHAHLKRFGMTTELSEFKGGKRKDSDEITKGKWGKRTTRALRMFAAHLAVGSEKEMVVKDAHGKPATGESIDEGLAEKIRTWCRGSVCSPQNYWEFKKLEIKANDCDVLGSQADGAKQTVLHDFIAQIETDLAKTGFAPHDDKLCGLQQRARPKGVFTQVKSTKVKQCHARPVGLETVDKNLTDLTYVVRKFQRQASWLWRMDKDGKHLADAVDPATAGTKAPDPSVYTGAETGEIDVATAQVLHTWAEKGLHMVMSKYPLKTVYLPGSKTPLRCKIDKTKSVDAKLREDVHEALMKAAKEIYDLGGQLGSDCASCPRGWKGGKPSGGNQNVSSYSQHYLGVAIDLTQALCGSDGRITDRHPMGREPDPPKNPDRFRLWCWAVPQPPVPAAPADDRSNAILQYRNRNIKGEQRKSTSLQLLHPSEPTESDPVFFATDNDFGHQKLTHLGHLKLTHPAVVG